MKSCVLLLTLACLAQSQAAPPATALRFNWPREMSAIVEAESTREGQGNRPMSMTTRGSSRLVVTPHAEGLVIKYDEFKLQGLPAYDPSALLEALRPSMPE